MQLSSPLTDELRLTSFQKNALKKLNLNTTKDLLWYFPNRYEETGEQKMIAGIQKGDKATLCGEITKIELEKTWLKKMNITRAVLNDETGAINLIWFHQPFIAKILKKGNKVSISGKIQQNKNGFYIANPNYSNTSKSDVDVNFDVGLRRNLLTIYPETRGLSSLWFQFTIQRIFKKILQNEAQLIDAIPKKILDRYHLPSLKNSLIYIHTPKETKNAEAARKRFAFEEIFLIQLSRIQKRLRQQNQTSFPIKINKNELENFTKNFPFELTETQKRATKHIIDDLKKGTPMARFLEGDVGSGKTAVAAIATYTIFKNGYQTAYMAPTEVLARQLFKSFIEYFKNTNVKIGLITSSESRKFPSKIRSEESTHVSKNRLLKWLGEGEIDIIIGTHSLIQDRVKFSIKNKITYLDKKLALVIIDEQHRFGTNQRAALINKKNENDQTLFPHLLSMSATPIPRTLALTIYGDLDLTLLDEMPPGRKKIITKIVPSNQREIAYEKVREEIKKGRQAYIICPRIDPSTSLDSELDSKSSGQEPKNLLTLNMRAVKEEHERLSKEVFPKFKLGMLYGKLKPKEKEETMNDFENGKIDVLIATSVIEVGVNVPNATTIIIEGAERFGLAQLHQLRGRVLRSTHQPYCFIFTESKTQKTKERLKALEQAKNGFELAEYDLQFRGPGELSGKKQWGISDVGMEALKNIKMVEAARMEAQDLFKTDPKLKSFPLLREKLKQENLNIHFE